MKRSGFDNQFQKLNQINLTEQESSQVYQQVLSKYKTANKRKTTGIIFNHFIPGFATIALLIVVGWFLSDLLQPSINQPGDETPIVVEEEPEEEEMEPEMDEEPESIPENISYACMESYVEPRPDSVLVYFECNHSDPLSYPPVRAVSRDMESDKVEERIEYAILQLIEGPSEEEKEDGYLSIFNEDTAGLLNGIELQDSGHLIVDFVDFSKIIPNGNSSAASMAMLQSLNTTIAQFEDVKTIEYRFDGSCEQFYGWLQRTCQSFQADDYRMDAGEEHKELLLERSDILFNHLMAKEWGQLANNIHSERGLVYSPFSNVGDEDDLHFTKEEVRAFHENVNLYSWSWDQSGAEFMATPNDFVENLLKTSGDYVYEYNEIMYNDSEMGTMINTIHDVYPNAIYVEYLDESDPNSMDWYKYQALRFVYEEIDEEWYLIAIVRGAHNP
ncbi:GerMN domain-containing protein [Ornithinibacillus californiensis]|uniref:GerMN domain-containing protein n=1 Tax=Ornithinibacillus californiensis TaxID=161536 RepID=UPI00064D7337|nr:GerMN domain-containing protein [Ornithinibacillus californiensis]